MSITKSAFSIRNITSEDIPVLVKYRLIYLKELQGNAEHKNEKILKRELEEYFSALLDEKKLIAFIAESEGKPISFGAMIIKEIPGDFIKSTYLEGDILNMYTIPEVRKQGISSMVLEKLLSEAKLYGISKVALHTSKDGENMYRKFGFKEPEYPYLEMIINKANFTH